MKLAKVPQWVRNTLHNWFEKQLCPVCGHPLGSNTRCEACDKDRSEEQASSM